MNEKPQQAADSISQAMGDTKMNREKQILKELKELMAKHAFSFTVGLRHDLNIIFWDDKANKYITSEGDIREVKGIEQYLQETE